MGSSPIGHPILPVASPKRPRKWRAPAPRALSSVRDAFRALSTEALAQIEVNAAGFARSDDPEFLHQMRVGLRRLRAALRALRPVLPRRGARALARRVRRLSPALGEARDWDVFCEWLQRRRAADAPARRRRQRARERARRLLGSGELSELLESVREAARWKTRQADLKALAQRRLEKSHGKALRKAAAIDWSEAARRHAMRIRLKRLRYAAEYFQPCFAGAGTRYVERLKKLQDILGELNDLAVARRLLARLPRTEASLAPQLAAQEARLLSELPAAWRAFAAARPFWRSPG